MPRFVMYVIVGLMSAIIDLTSLSILISLGTTQWLAVTVAFVAGFVFNLKAHTLFTFATPLTSKSALKYSAVVSINCLATLLIIEVLTTYSCSLMTAKVVSLPITAITGYFLGRHWAFKD